MSTSPSPAMARAMKKAGVAIPANKRIWEWLKEHGSHTGAEVSAALKMPLAASSSIISQMKARKMLSVETKFSEHLGRNVGYYAAAGRTFQVLPMPKKDGKVKAGDVVSATNTQQIIAPKPKSADLISTLSVVEAFELYKQLDGMFNKK